MSKGTTKQNDVRSWLRVGTVDRLLRTTLCALAALMALYGAALTPSAAASFCINSGGGTCINNVPLYLGTSVAPNVLFVLANSQNMDENGATPGTQIGGSTYNLPIGTAVGSGAPNSKSEIARSAIRQLVNAYVGQINFGLMTFKLNSKGSCNSGMTNCTTQQYLYNSFYDASYNPANWDPSYNPDVSGRVSQTKGYCTPNPSNPGTCSGAPPATTGTCANGDCVFYNWASPFYTSGLFQKNYCYGVNYDTNTPLPAKFDNTTNVPQAITSAQLNSNTDYYRCFNSKTGSSDTIPMTAATSYPAPDKTSSIQADETSAGYSSLQSKYWNWFYSTDTDLANGILDFGAEVPSIYAGNAWFSNGSPGTGYLNVPLTQLTTTLQGQIQNLLRCDVPPSPGSPYPANAQPLAYSPYWGSGSCNTTLPTNPNLTTSSSTSYSIPNAGLTAIQGTLESAQQYFQGTLSTSNGAPSSYTILNSCGKNYVVMLTNGLPSVEDNGQVLYNSNGQVDTCTMTSNAVTAATNLDKAGVPLYVVGFALQPSVLTTYKNSCNNDVNPLDQLAAAGGTGTAYMANSTNLQTTLSNVFNTILQKSGSSSALASNSTKLTGTSVVYQASYNTADWSGHLQAEQASNTNSVIWDAATVLTNTAPTNRNILTYNDNSTTGVAFQWSPLSANEQCLLAGQASGCTLTATQITAGQNVLSYVSGNQVSSSFRTRTDLLGDIINSNPVYAGTQDYGYSVLPGAEGSSYITYVQNKYSSSALPMIYVGANDGMLHGFAACASGSCASNVSPGEEVFAYVPSVVYGNLPLLTQTSYTANHQYYVDGTPGIGDAYYGLNGATPSWHTVLVGTLGGGGKAVFALDVTNPLQDTVSNASSAVLWEYPNSQDTAHVNDMGYSWGPPVIARFNDGNYYAVVNNGYDSVNGHAMLFLIPVNYIPGSTGGPKVITLDAGTGGSGCSGDGLSAPALLDADQNGTIDAIYAGDLCGNVWKFDVSSANSSNWGVAFKSGNGSNATPVPLFTAEDSSGNRQPITAPLVLGSVPSGASGSALVFFGTGQYLEPTDTTTTSTQTVYGVLDSSTFSGGAFSGGTSQLLRTNLQLQSIIAEQGTERAYSSNTVSYPPSGSDYGWYMDLIEPTGPAQIGERVVLPAQFDPSGTIMFTSMIPNTATCSYGGKGWKIYLEPATGGSPPSAFLDVNGDGTYDTMTLSNGTTAVVAGVEITGGIPSSSVTMSNGATSTTVTNNSSNTTQSWTVLNKQGNPRTSWSQIQ